MHLFILATSQLKIMMYMKHNAIGMLNEDQMQTCGCPHSLTASSSLRAEICSAGASMPSAVCLVRQSSLVHTFSPSILTSFMCRANDCAYFLPRGERFVSPPIRPNTLFSLSPCYMDRNIYILQMSSYYHIQKHKN